MDYLNLGWGPVDSRTLVWIAAQLHLDFAAFVLAVPLFALLIEFLGWRSKRPEYDSLAKEFVRLLPPAYGFTAITGAFLGFGLFVLYPKVMTYLGRVFAPTFLVYPLLFVAESLCLYVYYYLWDRLQGNRKPLHLILG